MFGDWDGKGLLGFIMVGSVAHVLTKWAKARNSRDEETGSLDLIDYIILALLAMFAGMVGGNLAGLITDDPKAVLAIAGLAAWAGIEGLRKFLDAALGILSKGAGK